MNNILNENLSLIEEKLLAAIAPQGVRFVGLPQPPQKLFSEDYISFVWVAFNHARKQAKNDFEKAVAIAKAQLNKKLS